MLNYENCIQNCWEQLMDISETMACRTVVCGLMFCWNLGHGEGVAF